LDALAMSLLVICCLFWGLQQVLVKATLADVPPMLQAAIRFAGATVLLWLWCRLRHVALFEVDGSLGAGLLAGALFCSEFVCIYLGLQYTSASRLTLFLYSAPFWVALLLPLRVKAERLRAVQWLGLGVAFASVGVALKDGLQTAHADSHGLSWLGDALALGAGVLWALTTVVIRSTRMATVSAEKMLFYQVGVSACVLPCLSWLMHESWPSSFSVFAWTSIAVQTVMGAFASYLVWMWLLRHYPATRLNAFVFLTPIFALTAGALWLGEPVTLGLLMALAGVALGIVLVNRTAKA
jgi:drug/metabolite transporter (DMT)-like permease